MQLFMRFFRFYGPCLALALLLGTARAQTEDALVHRINLAQALALAAQHNPELSAADLGQQAARAQAQQQGLLPNPELAYSQEGVPSSAGRSQSLQINWPLELGGKRAARNAVAEREAELAAAKASGIRARVRTEVVHAYFALLLAQEGQRLAQSHAQLAQNAAQAVDKRVAAGKVSPVEHSRALAAQATAQAQAQAAQAALRSAQAQLAVLLGQAATTRLEAADHALESPNLAALPDLPQPPPLAALQAQLEQSPALQSAQLERARSQAQLQLARSARWPDVGLSLGVKRTADAPASRNQLLLGFSVPLPLFNRQQGALQAAVLADDQAREQARASALQAGQALLQAYGQYESARAQNQLLQTQALPAAHSAYRAAGLGFEYGKFSFLELLDAQRSYLAVQEQILQTQSQAYRALADMEALLGQPINAGLPTTSKK